AQTELLNTLIGKDYEYYQRITDMDFNSSNVTAGNTSDEHHSYKKVNTNNSATLTYDFTMPKDGKLYMYLPSTYEREIEVKVNDKNIGKYFEGDNNYMRMLGEFKKDEKINVVFTLMKENLYFREAEFAVGDDEMMHKGLTELGELNKNTTCELGSATKVVSKVNCDRDMTFFTTIPVEKGWKVYVDGVKTSYTETVDSLICVPLTAGEHTVEMRFTTAGYPAAVLISIAGIIVFAGLIILWLKRNPEDRERRRAHLMTIYSGEAVREVMALKEADIAERKLYREGKINDEYDEDEFAEFEEEDKKDGSDSDAKDNDDKNDKNTDKVKDRKKEKKSRKEDNRDNEASENSGISDEVSEEQKAENTENAASPEKETEGGEEKNEIPPKEKKKG
ncbi:MAG: YfhO family protein, partial [Ruminiclostridium sp.]|nr:YfhO family protein [Ruminiclostridium sp.]